MSTPDKPPVPAIDLGVLARRQLHVILALDCSGSMRGDRIASLNYAVRSAIPELKSVAEENPEVQVFVRVLRFDTVARWHIDEPCPIAELEWEDVTAGGETAMGSALSMIADALDSEALAPRQLPPVIVLASDGYPTDDVDQGLEKLFAREAAVAATRIAIAIGRNTDMETLERFMDSPQQRLKPLRANNAPELVQSIKWATTAPVKATSSPTNAPDAASQLANEAPPLEAPGSSVVW
ncbi:MAG: VWA domain-containing protein [Pseudomonadales bacterium]